MFVILQKYDFSSKSQQFTPRFKDTIRCLWYCKSTIFQANHNRCGWRVDFHDDVCDTAKVRFFKQITTGLTLFLYFKKMFVILQKYDFSSKSQQGASAGSSATGCLWYCKSTIFQANHNTKTIKHNTILDVCDTAKVRFFKQITTPYMMYHIAKRCLWYCKSTIFQANHNWVLFCSLQPTDVCDTAKVRFFKQITTICGASSIRLKMFVILQKYDFSSKSQRPF